MKEITLKSGNVLRFGLPEIIKSLRLTNAIAQTFSKRGIDIKLDRETELSFKSLFDKSPEAFLKGASDVIFDENILPIVLDCASSCVYVQSGISKKITLDTFQDEVSRGDFYEIMIRIGLENVKPFFANLLTVSNQDTDTARSN